MALIIAVSETRLKRFFIISVIASTVISGQVIHSYATATAWRGAFVGGAGYLEIGRLIGTGVLILVYLGTKYRERWHLILTFTLLFTHIFALVISGGRAALLSTVIVIVLFASVNILYNNLKIIGSRIGITYICLSSAAVPFGLYYTINSGLRTLERVLLLFSSTGIGRSLSVRLHLYSSSIGYWLNQPLINNTGTEFKL
jgi:O-antigen ligase